MIDTSRVLRVADFQRKPRILRLQIRNILLVVAYDLVVAFKENQHRLRFPVFCGQIVTGKRRAHGRVTRRIDNRIPDACPIQRVSGIQTGLNIGIRRPGGIQDMPIGPGLPVFRDGGFKPDPGILVEFHLPHRRPGKPGQLGRAHGLQTLQKVCRRRCGFLNPGWGFCFRWCLRWC
jgi:hypothetical protein